MEIVSFIQKQFLIILLVAFSFDQVQAQILDYSYTHYGKEDGLPSNIIYCMTADHDGILWIGSDAGLTRFDGLHAQTFTTKDGLPTNDVFTVFCDRQNRIWVTGLSSKIAYYYNGKIFNVANEPNLSKIKLGTHCNLMFEDENKSLRVINSGLDEFTIDTNNRMTIRKLSSYVQNFSTPIHEVKLHDTILFLGGKETLVYKLDGNSLYYLPQVQHKQRILGLNKIGNTFYYLNDADRRIYKFDPSILLTNLFGTQTMNWALLTNQEHQLICSNTLGISFYDTSDLENPMATFLPKYSVLNYYQDPYGNNWVSTNGNGLFKINSKINKIYKNDLDETSNKFQCVYVQGDYYFLGDNKAMLTIVDRKKMKIVRKVNFNRVELKNCRILRISEFSRHQLAISTDNGFYVYNFTNDHIDYVLNYGSCKNHAILKDKTIILNNEGIVKCEPSKNKVEKIVFHKRFYSFIKFDGDTILGAQDGLNILNNRKLFPYQLNEPFSFRVMDMVEVDSVLILATINGGVYFVKNHQILQKLNTENGLSSNNCFKLVLHDNELYIGSSNGINIYNFKDKQIRSLNESDGLTSNSVNDILIEKDTLFAATENGLSIIPIKNMIVQSKFQLFNKPTIIQTDTIWTNSTKFETRTDWPFILNLNALSYGNKGQIKYFYRGVSSDSNFVSTSNPQISIQFPEPGQYTIYAYAVDANNKESNMIQIVVNVKPYFWQTILFRILAGLIILGSGYLLVQYLIQRARMKEIKKRQLDQKLFKLELEAWRSKMNPHFLFNSLNSVNSLIKTSQYQKAIDFIGNFAGILRQTIEHSGKLLNTVASEVQYIRKYLDLEMMKRENQFKYEIVCNDEKIWDYFIPSLLIQPVIENSIKHAIREKKDGEILIRFLLETDCIRCEISDNGNGVGPSLDKLQQSKSLGIELIEEKIRILESIIHQPIRFSYNFDDANTISKPKTTFQFPILTSNIYDTDHIS